MSNYTKAQIEHISESLDFDGFHVAAGMLRQLLTENMALQASAHPIVRDVLTEVGKAMMKFPTWPTDPIHAAAVCGEESGEITKAVLQAVYEPHKSGPADARMEAVQTAAMALRFIAGMPHYEWKRSAQFEQASLFEEVAA